MYVHIVLPWKILLGVCEEVECLFKKKCMT